jgi:hypothetical protein
VLVQGLVHAKLIEQVLGVFLGAVPLAQVGLFESAERVLVGAALEVCPSCERRSVFTDTTCQSSDCCKSSELIEPSGIDSSVKSRAISATHAAASSASVWCPWPCQSPRWWPGKVLAVVSK